MIKRRHKKQTLIASPLLAQSAAAPITMNTWLQKKLDTGASLSAADIMALIQPEGHANQDSRSRPLDPPGKPNASLFDPLSFPGTRVPGNRKTQKWQDVHDYVSMTNRGCGENASDSLGTVRIGDVELAFKDKKIPIESISMSQYMEGSIRIMREMVSQEGCSLDTVMDYAGYTS